MYMKEVSEDPSQEVQWETGNNTPGFSSASDCPLASVSGTFAGVEGSLT